MRRFKLRMVALAGVVGLLTACSTTTESDDPRIGRFLLHLNNDSRTERWRDGLIEIGRRGDRGKLLRELERAYDRSMALGGHGVGILRHPGRYRVMLVVGGLGKTPRGVAILERGLKEGHRVGLAAATVLVSWGDASAVPALAKHVQEFPEGDPDREKGLQTLRQATESPKAVVVARGGPAGH